MRLIATIFTLCIATGAASQVASMQMVGEARLSVLFWSIYDSRLYSTDGRYREGQRPVRLEIEYQLDITAQDLVERTAAEWRSMGRSHPRQREWLEALARLWPDVDKGDIISMEVDAQERSFFYNNGKLLGSVDDPSFGQHFLDIWLSPNTTRPGLRLSLIGQR